MKIGKNIVFIFLAILLVGGSFVFAEYRNRQAKSIYKAPEVSASSLDTSAQYIDTDGDGVPDWEEVLVGTNPNDPKSKSTKATSTPTIKDLTKTTEKLDPIDVVSREFFARYMELRQLGISSDKLNQQELAQKTIDSIKFVEAKPYVMSDILVNTITSKESIKKYGNDMANVFKKYFVSSRNEGVIVKDALQKKDPEILKELDPVIESYKNIVSGLLKTEAPKSMGTMHLDLVNVMNSTLFVMQSFRKTMVDPIAGVQAMSQYLIVQKKFFDSLKAIQSYLIYSGITYTSSETGFFFVHPK